MKTVLEITEANIEEVLAGENPVVVDFWAEWCGPCRAIAPIIQEMAEQHAEKVTFGKVNVDNEPNLARRFQIQSIPTLVVFEKSLPVQRLVGARTKEELERQLGLP